MKIATFNVNGVNGRLPVLMRWLAEAKPDVACLQELKAQDEKFPEPAIRQAGYRAVWHGQKGWNGVAILARDRTPMETRRGLPGDPDDAHSRYIEAAVEGVLIGCLYMPNGNPAPGPKFDYKLRWFDRLATHAAELLATGMPVVLVGDFNVMPTELDVYSRSGGSMMRCSGPRCARLSMICSRKAGPMRCGLFIQVSAYIRSGTTSGTHGRGTRVFGSTTCCLARRLSTVSERRRWTGRSAVGRRRAIMHRPGSSWPMLERAAFGCGERQRRALGGVGDDVRAPFP